MIAIGLTIFATIFGLVAIVAIWFALFAWARGWSGQILADSIPGKGTLVLALIGAIGATIVTYQGMKALGVNFFGETEEPFGAVRPDRY